MATINPLEIVRQIISQKDADIDAAGRPALTPEIRELAEDKRFTFDVMTTPVDPLR